MRVDKFLEKERSTKGLEKNRRYANRIPPSYIKSKYIYFRKQENYKKIRLYLNIK